MKGSLEVVTMLQAIVAGEAHINEQYRLDERSLKLMGFKWIKHKMHRFGDRSHCFRKILLDRILFLQGTPKYDCGEVMEQTTVTAMYQGNMKLEQELAGMCTEGIALAVKLRDEATAEKLRHIEERHEENVGWYEQQLALIAAFTEKDYLLVKV